MGPGTMGDDPFRSIPDGGTVSRATFGHIPVSILNNLENDGDDPDRSSLEMNDE